MDLIQTDSIPLSYSCALTEELDRLCGIDKKDFTRFRHYLLADKWCLDRNCLAIRVPGGTVGGVTIDENKVITDIKIDTNYVIKTYPDDVNEKVRKYIGETVKIIENK